MKFSLIVATLGRFEEVGNFLKSVEQCNYDNKDIEIIIVDQNETSKLDAIVNEFKNLNIIHVKSKIKGLSQNRNIGIAKATGEIIAFPDDDCEYLMETLFNVDKVFEKEKCDIVMGRIVERDGSDSLRSWPKETHKINKLNFYTRCSSITMFFKNNGKLKLNEKLGVGNYFGSCEDTDILYRSLSNGSKVIYNPSIAIYHPHYDSKKNMTEEKIYNYALGFGGFVKSNLHLDTAFLSLKVIGFHSVKAMINLLKGNSEQFKKSLIAIKGRIKGYIQYKN
ncbi:glycosyltransferase family 2 protein [Clostridium culturomicium]|uniref:glycosyltransferase family 2 protein n=1 Tax=Clostridium culturomicium TaxID=1499683 RepID=UPI000A8C301E|nr:glycosyltransferase family 2 protein [Clostridium culturomicium]